MFPAVSLLDAKQFTFDDIQDIQIISNYVKELTPTQINIIAFIEQGLYQSYIAKRLKISRSYVNTTVKTLLKHKLIQQQTFSPLQKKSYTYQSTPKLKSLLKNSKQLPSHYTLCIPHHIKFKYPITSMQNQLSRDGWKFSKSRSIYVRAWKPKGTERLLYHVNLGEHTIGVEFHGKSIVAYRIEHSHILAESIEEATQIISSEIGKGVETFLREQESMNCRITLGQPQQIDKTHYAFESVIAKQAIIAGQQIKLEGVYIDNSPQGQGRGSNGDIETKNPSIATSIDNGLRNAMNIPQIINREIGQAIPQAMLEFAKQLNPLKMEIETLNAHIHAGQTIQYQVNQMLTLMASQMKEITDLKTEISKLKGEPV